jgi:hypothetical protein
VDAATMTPEAAASLREPFPPEAVGKLPRGGTQLDYVGHAAVTDRLLQVDPLWTWEPLAVAPDGGPLIRTVGKDAELWSRLTVCGHTRIGVGTAAATSFELSKQLVSDALRNAAMRFGVALDLWTKQDLHDTANPEPDEPKIPETRAAQIAAELNAAPKGAITAWRNRFKCAPADLPLSSLTAANAFLTDLKGAPDAG